MVNIFFFRFINLYFFMLTQFLIIFICFFFIENDNSVILFDNALQKAKNENKQLIVIGSPESFSGKFINIFKNTYGCGDLCIDMNGCGKCKNSISDKIENVINKFESNKYVIFESGLLEVVDDSTLDYTVNEMYRITNKTEHIYSRHYIQNYKFFFRYFIKYLYKFTGEGSIHRFVNKFPPHHKYEFEKI